VTVTAGVEALPDMTKARVLAGVRSFTDFDPGNDPHREHDFASFEVDAKTTSSKSIITTRRCECIRRIPPIRQ
jgi:hypothetical protein